MKKIVSKHITTFIIIVLILLSVFFGFKIYKQNEQNKSIASASPQPSFATFSSRTVLDTPSIDSTDDQRKEYEALVRKESKSVDQVNISNCEADPLVAIVKISDAIKFKNNSENDHAIVIGDGEEFTLLSNKVTPVKAKFPKGAGIYAYGCDKSPRPIGVLLVEP